MSHNNPNMNINDDLNFDNISLSDLNADEIELAEIDFDDAAVAIIGGPATSSLASVDFNSNDIYMVDLDDSTIVEITPDMSNVYDDPMTGELLTPEIADLPDMNDMDHMNDMPDMNDTDMNDTDMSDIF